MSFVFYDPQPFKNDYVSRMFLAPMQAYAEHNGIPARRTNELAPVADGTFVCNADYYTPEVIRWFHENNCPMVAISCIDSAYLSESFRHAPEILMLNRVFAVTGIQNTNISNATVIDDNFNITTEPRRFLPEEDWNRFDEMRQTGRLLSLPYVPWDSMENPPRKSFSEKRPTAIFRGGNHFFRVLAWLKAMSNGAADERSGFQTRDYFQEKMNPDFRYCEDCRFQFRRKDYYPLNSYRGGCTSPAPWGGVLDVHPTGRWNNRCPASYYWLAVRFHERYGNINMNSVETAMNYRSQEPEDHLRSIRDCRFYADSKWEFSINMAQRFWEGACAGTVNLIPRRANDQDYFPVMKDGEHYLTFADDFSDLTSEVDEARYQAIADNTHALWEEWIKPTQYAISSNLLKWMFDQCAF